METVNVETKGYEWECPCCGHMNDRECLGDTDKCDSCGEEVKTVL